MTVGFTDWGASVLDILPFESGDFLNALDLQRTQGLLTNDSLHLAMAISTGNRMLATADPQFSYVPDFTVFGPDDIK